MSEQKCEQTFNEKENELLEKMSKGLREIWKIVFFVALVGFLYA